MAILSPLPPPHDQGVQTTPRAPAPSRARQPGSGLGAAAAPAVVGAAWLAIAGVAAWLVYATPLLARLAGPESRGSAAPVVGAVAWAVALTAPACFAVLGIVRLAGAVQRARGARGGATSPVARRAALLPPGCAVIPRIRLPDGRRIPDVVVGPHGIAFFEPLPPAAAARRTRERWAVRVTDRTWRALENPVPRATPDGGRLRRHLESHEREFVVRVQAAVLGDEHEVGRSEGCAVVALDDVPAWLAALPAQRGLTPDRLAHLREVLADLA
jgi:hypothetical protein